ncbi:hypothetical protein Pan216_39500 [Planctomycetes bacterium Pan216]|uniref:Uncharacterized protein n=1 Tax=Kolteria novifilia TaxID=2527975 RepID=A0A518B7X5_9BACT|nr:hypothetical protein Pan216_39500 [Planctomycetes bacterium Pan216]
MRLLYSCALLCFVGVGVSLAGPKAEDKPDLAAMQKAFQEKLSGATLVGHYTMEGPGGEVKKSAAPEKYTITKVDRGEGDRFIFIARIQYGDKDIAVPLTLRVLWAGNTPVITLDELNVPGLGTYSARVMIFEDRYAGVWSHGDVGGSLWGKIEKADK